MAGEFNLLWVGLVILVIIVISIVAQKAKERRQQEFRALAARHGFQMIAPEPPGCLSISGGWWSNTVIGDNLGIAEELQPFDPFDTGDDRAITLMVHGEKDGGYWHLLDYQYETGSGKSRQTHHVSAVAARVGLLFPAMSIREQGFFDNIGSAIGFRDIQFESDEFNRRYYVKCGDERRCFDIVHPQMIEYLMSIPPRHIQMGGPYFLCVLQGKADPWELERAMADMQGFLERIPEYVRQDIGFCSPSPDPGEREPGGEGSH